MEQLTMAASALLAALALLGSGVPAPAAPAPADTTVAVARGDRLILENFGGRLSVGVHDDGFVRIRSQADDPGPVEVTRGDGRVAVRSPDRHGHGARGPFEVTVPGWMPVEIRGSRTEIEARDLQGGLQVRSLHGSIRLYDVAGPVEARTVHGEVVAEGVSGRVVLHSVEGDVRIRGGSGELVVETVDGDVALEDIDADRLSASSVDGDVALEGRLPAGARYRLTTHDGNLRVTLPGSVGAEVTVSTFDGEFISDFPVTLRRFRGGQEMRFTLGEGSAQLVLEAFDGDIELRRRGG